MIVALDLGTTTGWATHTADGNTVSGTKSFRTDLTMSPAEYGLHEQLASGPKQSRDVAEALASL